MLTGMTGSEKVVYKLVDLVVKSMDDSVEVELCKVRGKVKTVTRQTQQVASQREETLLAVLISFTSIDIPNVEDEEV